MCTFVHSQLHNRCSTISLGGPETQCSLSSRVFRGKNLDDTAHRAYPRGRSIWVAFRDKLEKELGKGIHRCFTWISPVGDGAQACCTVPLLLQHLASSKTLSGKGWCSWGSSRVWGGSYRKMGDINRITALLPHLVRDLFNPTNTPGGRKICVAGFKAQNTTCSSRDEGGLEDWRKVGETRKLEPYIGSP